MAPLKIEYRQASELKPYHRNARTHSVEQIDRIAASIREFGWTNPVLVDGNKGVIAGHGRLLAAKKLGIERIPCIELAGLSKAQKAAYVLADNKLALDAGWDFDSLRLELSSLQEIGFDLSLTGFGDIEIAGILADKSAGLTDPDEEQTWDNLQFALRLGDRPRQIITTTPRLFLCSNRSSQRRRHASRRALPSTTSTIWLPRF